MKTTENFERLLPLACEWAEEQERLILTNGVELDDDQKIDAYLVGVKDPRMVRLMAVENIPVPDNRELKEAMEYVGLLTQSTIGVTFRYGIYIKKSFWQRRNLIVHELCHTMQYERLGGEFKPFLNQYILECMAYGYPYGPLEEEARNVEIDICSK